jgi:hypothetical protein
LNPEINLFTLAETPPKFLNGSKVVPIIPMGHVFKKIYVPLFNQILSMMAREARMVKIWKRLNEFLLYFDCRRK